MEKTVVKKKADEKTLSLAQLISSLRPNNNALYGVSGELETLIALLEKATNAGISLHAVRSLEIQIEQIFRTSAHLLKTTQLIRNGLREEPKQEQLKH